MAEALQIDGNSPEYEAWVAKFKTRHSSDDTFTPQNVYEVVRDWCVRRYGLEGSAIVRPFWPGGDYTRAVYTEGCAVVDNPPFSILSEIVAWYNERGIRFFLFAPGLSSIQYARDGKTAFVAVHYSITFANGAYVNTSFITNMEPPDVLATTASDLRGAIEAVDRQNVRRARKHVAAILLPAEVLTGARMGYLAVHHVPYTAKRADAAFIRKLDNYARGVFGGAFLLSPRAAAERAAAERAAAERAAAERAAAERIELSDREKGIVRNLERTNR